MQSPRDRASSTVPSRESLSTTYVRKGTPSQASGRLSRRSPSTAALLNVTMMMTRSSRIARD
ncbi:hypothetical protein ASG49_08135 [Marmoricola sp. Leaf446]|nr:hypothetical protein ASG49_08135 [Marmoricola sp. Leaf446]